MVESALAAAPVPAKPSCRPVLNEDWLALAMGLWACFWWRFLE